MFMKKIFFAVILGLILSIASQTKAFASFNMPSFPTCVNPQGTIIANYNSGTHGIAGNTSTYTGFDTVYQFADGAYTQCFCPFTGSGIQTNWMKANGISDSDLKDLENQGWIYEPAGDLWGLTNDPYLALNSSYSCNTSQAIVESATAQSSGSSNSSSSNSSHNDPGVSQLAITGNIVLILGLLTAGIISLISGFLLKLRNK